MTRAYVPNDGRLFVSDPGPLLRELADEVIGLSCCAPCDCGDVGALMWRLDTARPVRPAGPCDDGRVDRCRPRPLPPVPTSR